MSNADFAQDFILSKDGTRIGYRQKGSGPAVLLIHGGLQTSFNFLSLGRLLAEEFTVYIMDRRGRSTSGPHGAYYSLARECEDVEALLEKTGAGRVFGLSSGALIALESARKFPVIRKLAVYEPPLATASIDPTSWLPRYEKELAEKNPAAAFVTLMKGTGDRFSIGMVPRFLLVPLFRRLMIREAVKPVNEIPITELIPTMHFDGLLVQEIKGKLQGFSKIKAETLILGGTRSKDFLKAANVALKNVLPQAKLITFRGVGHIAADNNGKPELVAEALLGFFR